MALSRESGAGWISRALSNSHLDFPRFPEEIRGRSRWIFPFSRGFSPGITVYIRHSLPNPCLFPFFIRPGGGKPTPFSQFSQFSRFPPSPGSNIYEVFKYFGMIPLFPGNSPHPEAGAALDFSGWGWSGLGFFFWDLPVPKGPERGRIREFQGGFSSR